MTYTIDREQTAEEFELWSTADIEKLKEHVKPTIRAWAKIAGQDPIWRKDASGDCWEASSLEQATQWADDSTIEDQSVLHASLSLCGCQVLLMVWKDDGQTLEAYCATDEDLSID